jgi:hypothetical protein
MDFHGKVVWVTGSSSGIGEATIKEFASLGADVVIHYYQHKEQAESIEKFIQSHYQVETLLVQGDVANEEDVKRMVEEVLSKFGQIDVLVNNAGIAIDTTFEDKTVDNFRRTLDVNLIGTFLMGKYIGKIMFNQKTGRIINISSTNGIDTVYPESIDYDASKAGVLSLTKNLAIQYAPYVLVNTLAPGWVNTPMNQELDSEMIEAEEKKILLGRFASPEEIAHVVVFLASDKASYINASVLRVDGGFYV